MALPVRVALLASVLVFFVWSGPLLHAQEQKPNRHARQESNRTHDLNGIWKVALNKARYCLRLAVRGVELTGDVKRCPEDEKSASAIEFGIQGRGGFVFTAREKGEAWIWTGSFDPQRDCLVGRRERISNGAVEEFVAQR